MILGSATLISSCSLIFFYQKYQTQTNQLQDEIKKLKLSETAVADASVSMAQLYLEIEESRNELKKANHGLEENQIIMEQYANALKTTLDQLAETNQILLDSITYAQRIQQAIIPNSEQLCAYFPDSFSILIPKHIVSGDFYYLHQDDTRKYVICADCTGHGVPGAFMSLIGIMLLDKIFGENHSPEPAQILTRLNHEIKKWLKVSESDNLKDSMDISVTCYCPEYQTLAMASSMRPIALFRNNQLEVVNGDKLSIGWGDFVEGQFQTQKFTIQPGDSFYLFSDGFVDQFGGKEDRKFNLKRFFSLIEENASQQMKDQYAVYLKEFQEWKGETEQTDDVIFLGIRV